MAKTPFLLILIFTVCCTSTKAQPKANIIPVPNKIDWKQGSFYFTKCTQLHFDKRDKELGNAIMPLVVKLKRAAAIDLLSSKKCADREVYVAIDKSISNEEGYKLNISKEKVEIKAQKPAGVFYAVQSLLQLLPESIESETRVSNINWAVPCVQVEDAPRLRYRGIMLDVSRNFMVTDSIKRMIDLLAMQKMNRLHWHLTDNEGWRFESKKYPKLTSIGAFRKGDIIDNKFTYDYKSKPHEKLYGGYYTQEQMRDIVQYAADRFITIIPEIEMPAHAQAAVAAYPELACLDSNGKAFPYPSNIQAEFCTRNETVNFLSNVLSEVMEIFPSKYIHIGGDEAEKLNWKTCKYCRQRMKEQGLNSVEDLQSDFINRIEKFVNSKGRSIIGWDEIMQGGLAPNAAVMSWTGVKPGIEAAKNSHYAAMTPLPYCYFDHAQSDAPGEPPSYYGLTMLSDVYNYEPVSQELNTQQAKYIMGAQGNLWTTYVPTAAIAEYMIFPRSTALAEVNWSSPSNKNFSDFTRRLLSYEKRLDQLKVNYSKHLYDIRVSNIKQENGKLVVELSGSENGNPIYFTLDGTIPNQNSPVYKQPVPITQSCTINAAVIINGNVRDLAIKSYILHKAVGKKGTLKTLPSYNKSGLDGWINGGLADDTRFNDYRNEDEERYNDDKWLGWENEEFNGTIDFGKAEEINKVTMRFFHNLPFGIMIPKSVTLQTSDDGINFKDQATQTISLPDSTGAVPLTFSLPALKSRFVRVIAQPFGKTPAGNYASLFIDEVIVE
ncbi:family 20 glycosylhydrolase [Rubrolithibacter danxiaensis]|uniref:glycoside hydrolase family 20 protein n=1 Tax=Rubrolithibacter danxiaensis TaxID=3390805 RepID=UPI003BF88D35